MAQALLQSPYAVPVLQIVAGVAVVQLVCGRSPLTDFVGNKLTDLSNESLKAAKKVIFDSPVIALTAGLTYLVQEFVAPKLPSLSLAMPECTSLKTAMCVAGILAVRSSLSLYLDGVISENKAYLTKNKPFEDLRKAVVRNVVPIAAACTAAYYAEVPVKLAKTALYTASLIPVVKLLGSGLEGLMSLDVVKDAADTVIGWIK